MWGNEMSSPIAIRMLGLSFREAFWSGLLHPVKTQGAASIKALKPSIFMRKFNYSNLKIS
jgi:hypothetical protein